jgi:hypothetical protein
VFYKIEDNPHLVKDSHSKAVLNTDEGAIARHKERLAKVSKDLQRDNQINQLKKDMDDIKSILQRILEKV